ncbi:YbhB/YbcL family Raf kinase inhibitor-like protein [Lactobacillus sp. Sy-1]|uniref:YbhB/YbcL family Raf kinase inhibitor-like protein n=1 Tax=Lactobacillus sp. Sy-1 TaxID=2109645 RepID=UPI001C592D36|nr:YbhB/YbcL family Raf kinase inhibitor-like protein [Lactobacillus sp. Sy-1]MBW1605262.1 YbhB/YbcL family Raf kinase inhibitor-like protein [Lactobacillus sp. Sy-1]
MNINVPLTNGHLGDQYTKHAAPDQKIGNVPFISFPIEINNVPENTQSLSLVMLDWDSIPVCGFAYIHWVACNIDPKTTLIPENASHNDSIGLVHGNNSTAGPLAGPLDPVISQRYLGPTPPNCDHDYTLTIYALDTKLPLQDGFWLNELRHQMKGHVIEQASVELPVLK